MRPTLFLVCLATASLVACTGGDDGAPFCGDNACGAGEDTNNCAADCPANQVCGDGTCSGTETTASCPGDCPANQVCGDGTCTGTETTASCPGDCPANQVCGDGTCSGTETTASCPGDCPCTNNLVADDTCTGENVCVNGACVSAFGRNYHIVIGGGQMTQNNAAGTTWDAAGGLPDPLVGVTLNGASLGQTSTEQDTLTPSWDMFFTAVIAGGSSFQIQVDDEDVTVNDPMFGCVASPTLTAATIRKVFNVCDSGASTPAGVGSSVMFWFEPQ